MEVRRIKSNASMNLLLNGTPVKADDNNNFVIKGLATRIIPSKGTKRRLVIRAGAFYVYQIGGIL
jgi:hypothetical protein